MPLRKCRGRVVMGNKHESTARQFWLRTHAPLVFLGIFLAGIWGPVAYQAIHAKPKPEVSQTAQGIPVYFKRAEDAMLFPATVDPAKFTNKWVRAVYQVARENSGSAGAAALLLLLPANRSSRAVGLLPNRTRGHLQHLHKGGSARRRDAPRR